MMNFGAPRLGNKEFTRVYRHTVPESYRVVNRLDIVHKIPFFLKHVNRELEFEEDGDVVIDKKQAIRLEDVEDLSTESVRCNSNQERISDTVSRMMRQSKLKSQKSWPEGVFSRLRDLKGTLRITISMSWWRQRHRCTRIRKRRSTISFKDTMTISKQTPGLPMMPIPRKEAICLAAQRLWRNVPKDLNNLQNLHSGTKCRSEIWEDCGAGQPVLLADQWPLMTLVGFHSCFFPTCWIHFSDPCENACIPCALSLDFVELSYRFQSGNTSLISLFLLCPTLP